MNAFVVFILRVNFRICFLLLLIGVQLNSAHQKLAPVVGSKVNAEDSRTKLDRHLDSME